MPDDDENKGNEGAPPAPEPVVQPKVVEFDKDQQAAIDTIVANRITRARTKWDEEQKEAARQSKLDAQSRTQEELAQARAEAQGLQSQLDQAGRREAILLDAAAKGVRGDQMTRFLKLAATEDPEQEPALVVDALLRDFPELKGLLGRTGNPMDEGHLPPSLAEFQGMNSLQRSELRRDHPDSYALLERQEHEAIRAARTRVVR